MPILLTLYELYAVWIRHSISKSEDVQYKQVNHKVLVQEALLENTLIITV